MSSSVFAQRVAVSPHFPSFHGRQYDSAEFANLPKTGNLSTLLAVPSMLKPMEKLSELSKQRRTCFKRKMTLQKLSWHTNPYPCGVVRVHLSYFWRPDPMHPPLHYNVPPTELARNRGLETGEKQKKDEAKAALWYLTKGQWVTSSKTRGASVGPKRKQASHSPCKTVKSAATLPCRGSRRCHKKKHVRTST